MKRIGLLALVLLGISGPAFAQHVVAPRPAKPVIAPTSIDISKAITDAISVLTRIKSGQDLADQLAKANTLPEQVASNQIAEQCYEAISSFTGSFITQLQTLPTNVDTTDPLVLAPALFQINRSIVKEVINGVPTPIATGCAALAQDVQMDVTKLLLTLVGGAALKTLAGGIALPPIPPIFGKVAP